MLYPRLRDCREDRDWSQRELAAMLGLDQRVYSNYETGKRALPLHVLVKLADIYQTSTDYLLGRTSNPSPPRR